MRLIKYKKLQTQTTNIQTLVLPHNSFVTLEILLICKMGLTLVPFTCGTYMNYRNARTVSSIPIIL